MKVETTESICKAMRRIREKSRSFPDDVVKTNKAKWRTTILKMKNRVISWNWKPKHHPQKRKLQSIENIQKKIKKQSRWRVRKEYDTPEKIVFQWLPQEMAEEEFLFPVPLVKQEQVQQKNGERSCANTGLGIVGITYLRCGNSIGSIVNRRNNPSITLKTRTQCTRHTSRIGAIEKRKRIRVNSCRGTMKKKKMSKRPNLSILIISKDWERNQHKRASIERTIGSRKNHPAEGSSFKTWDHSFFWQLTAKLCESDGFIPEISEIKLSCTTEKMSCNRLEKWAHWAQVIFLLPP